jgi:TonB family protein
MIFSLSLAILIRLALTLSYPIYNKNLKAMLTFLQINLLLVIFYGLYHLLLKNETFHYLNRAYLIISVILAIVLPFINFQDIRLWFLTKQVQEVIYTVQLPAFEVIANKKTTFSWLKMGLFLYVIIGIFFLIKLIVGITSSLKKANLPEFRHKNAFSIFGRIVVDTSLPLSATIELHEQIHSRQYHFLDLLFFEFLSVVFWANPAIYFYKKAIKIVHEFTADAEVSRTLTSKDEYAMLLFYKNYNCCNEMGLAHFFFSKSNLKIRIMMLMKNPSKKQMLLKYGIVLPLIIVGLISTHISCTKTEEMVALEAPKEQNLKSENQQVEIIIEELPKKNSEEVAKKFPPVPEAIPMVISPSAEEAIFTAVEQNPEFPEGVAAMYEYLGKNIKYPAAAQRANVSGRVFVRFIVEKNGSISNVEITKGIGFGCDAESIRVIQTMPTWQPGIQNGKPVRTYYQMPIVFKIE